MGACRRGRRVGGGRPGRTRRRTRRRSERRGRRGQWRPPSACTSGCQRPITSSGSPPVLSRAPAGVARGARAYQLGAGRRPRRRAGVGGGAWRTRRRPGARRRAGHARPPRRRPFDVTPPRSEARRSLPTAVQAGRAGRAAGVLRRRSSPALRRAATRSRSPRRSLPPHWSCSSSPPASSSGPGRGEAGARRRRRRHAARGHRAAARGDRGRGADPRRPAGAVPPGPQRAGRPAVRARQVPHDATGSPRRGRSAARHGAR